MHARRILGPFLVIALAVGGGCSSTDDEVKPSPIPPGYARLLQQHQGAEGHPAARTTGGSKVDETLAVVDAEVLTRREMARSLRIKPEDLAKPENEDEVREARVRWARQRLVIGAARRAGLHIPHSMVDSIAKDQLRGEMKLNEEQTGLVLAEDEYLRERHLTWREYREQLSGAITVEYYTRKLYEGIGGARPQVDKEVTPAEVRRLYYDNRERFDEPYGVKAVLFRMPTSDYEAEGRDYLESEQMAERGARQVAEALSAGAAPKDVAQRFRLPDGRWQISKGFLPDHPIPQWRKWLFDRSRRPGDATIVNDGAGPVVLGIVDIRQPRRHTLEEPKVYDTIVRLVQGARKEHMLVELTLHLLRRGSVVWPPELHDELVDMGREELDGLSTDDFFGKARLK